MKLEFLYGFGWDNLVKEVNLAKKKTKIRCTDCEKLPIIETATGKKVMDLYKVTFEGNLFQVMKTSRILKSFKHE